MFAAALLITAKKQKQPKCPSNSKRINEMWYIHTKEYLAIKISEILIEAITQTNLKNVMLSKRTRLQMKIYCMVPFV